MDKLIPFLIVVGVVDVMIARDQWKSPRSGTPSTHSTTSRPTASPQAKPSYTPQAGASQKLVLEDTFDYVKYLELELLLLTESKNLDDATQAMREARNEFQTMAMAHHMQQPVSKIASAEKALDGLDWDCVPAIAVFRAKAFDFHHTRALALSSKANKLLPTHAHSVNHLSDLARAHVKRAKLLEQ